MMGMLSADVRFDYFYGRLGGAETVSCIPDSNILHLNFFVKYFRRFFKKTFRKKTFSLLCHCGNADSGIPSSEQLLGICGF